MTENDSVNRFQYDERLSTDISGSRRYWLDDLELTQHKITTLSLIALGETQGRDSEDYADLIGSIGTLFQYVGNRMLHRIYSQDEGYEEVQDMFIFKDMEDLHLSLETVEQFKMIGYLVKQED